MLPNSYTAVHRYDGAIIQRQRCDDPKPCSLRQRDLAIVRDVWRYHFLTTNQVRELWWRGKSIQAARRRLVKLLRAGYLERFRPYSPRGSYEWTYFLSAEGHRLLRNLGVVDPGSRFKPRDVFDYGRAMHDIQLNAWILAYRRLLGAALLEWHGEHQLTPPRSARQGQLRLNDDWSVEGLRDPQPRPVVPDAALEIANDGAQSPRLFLIEYDRTSRIDKNYDKFRRYDACVSWWWRRTELGGWGDAPFVLFICQDAGHRDDFLARADHELTGHRWHPSLHADQHEYIGRRRILFCDERDAHMGHAEARRLPPYPPGHPARRGPDAEIRGVRLPTSPVACDPRSPWPSGSGANVHELDPRTAARLPDDRGDPMEGEAEAEEEGAGGPRDARVLGGMGHDRSNEG
jgi:protein involved in plasmid replication-relaxation